MGGRGLFDCYKSLHALFILDFCGDIFSLFPVLKLAYAYPKKSPAIFGFKGNYRGIIALFMEHFFQVLCIRFILKDTCLDSKERLRWFCGLSGFHIFLWGF